MKVFVVIPRPKRAPVALEVSKDDTLARVKAKLHDMEGLPPSRQRLTFPYSTLLDDDGTTLAHGFLDQHDQFPDRPSHPRWLSLSPLY
jgi:hypothetical protein